ncbi:hypothetical protein BCR33DRAFT_734279 [Rhizoclosmatium globosum]|uniref:Uncharacterized protein n=1 Tax=Rhizoclosmatium globosum TaxID=329046 RepID=A0A1Y2CTD3_9FUNG|nr:hypothetical protein BCR33DRAFT_734279 [Rhizoclosmatium globosum]|eukprot:ORY50273.1 hypothetical protein BCR33DRAFT_734279 [Rhizoclosmatium globosum]
MVVRENRKRNGIRVAVKKPQNRKSINVEDSAGMIKEPNVITIDSPNSASEVIAGNYICDPEAAIGFDEEPLEANSMNSALNLWGGGPQPMSDEEFQKFLQDESEDFFAKINLAFNHRGYVPGLVEQVEAWWNREPSF